VAKERFGLEETRVPKDPPKQKTNQNREPGARTQTAYTKTPRQLTI